MRSLGAVKAQAVHCPACRHDKCALGWIEPVDSDDPAPSKFHPAGTHDWVSPPGVRLEDGPRLHCCLKCGLVWSRAAPDRVVAILKKHTNVPGWPATDTYFMSLQPPGCPACVYRTVVPGGLVPGFEERRESSFHPLAPRHWESACGTKLLEGNFMHCCLRCGLVWGHVQAEKVMDILAKLGVPRGEVPVLASYAKHLAKWVLFLLASAALAAWMRYVD